METHSIAHGERTLSYDDYGGNGPCVVALHGLTGSCKSLRFITEALTDRFRVIAVDLSGRGQSTGFAGSSILSHEMDVSALIAALGLRQIILMGYSMGGFIAASIASRSDNVAALVLLDGGGRMGSHQSAIVEPSLSRLSRRYESRAEYHAQMSAMYAGLGISMTPVLAENIAYELEETADGAYCRLSEEQARGDWRSFYRYDAASVSAGISQPTLLVECMGSLGEKPPLFYPESYINFAGNPNVHSIVSETNHYSLVCQKNRAVNQSVSEFLDKIFY